LPFNYVSALLGLTFSAAKDRHADFVNELDDVCSYPERHFNYEEMRQRRNTAAGAGIRIDGRTFSCALLCSSILPFLFVYFWSSPTAVCDSSSIPQNPAPSVILTLPLHCDTSSSCFLDEEKRYRNVSPTFLPPNNHYLLQFRVLKDQWEDPRIDIQSTVVCNVAPDVHPQIPDPRYSTSDIYVTKYCYLTNVCLKAQKNRDPAQTGVEVCCLSYPSMS